MILSFSSYIKTFILVIIERIFFGFSSVPTVNDWLKTIALLLVYSAIALTLGFWLNFLQLDLQFSSAIALKVAATSLVAPAILEELFFRVILLPYPGKNSDLQHTFIWAIISLLLFTIYHPLNAITFFPNGRETFLDPVFLVLATLLGIFCIVAYLQSGSIWSPVIIHWLTVTVWLLCLGGRKKLKFSKVNI